MANKFPAKRPSDELIRKFVWTDWLETGETILVNSPPTITVTTADGNASVAPGLVVDSITVSADGQSVLFFARGGVNGVTYNVDCHVSTTESETVTKRAQMAIKDGI